MHKMLLVLCLTFATTSLTYANEEAPATPQQERMRACNKEAGDKGLQGDQRKQFMRQCLKGGSAGEPAQHRTAQQQRMADCSREAAAKSLKGDERRKFMRQCLSGKP